MCEPAARLLFFYNHTGGVSGAEIVLLSVLRGLDRSRYEPVLISPVGDLSAAVENLSIRHIPVPSIQARFTKNPVQLINYAWGAVGVVRQMRSLLRQHRPALLHANSIRAGVVASMASVRLGQPVVWHLHDILPDHPFSNAIRKLARSQKQLAFIAVSNATAHSFTHVAGAAVIHQPVEVVYNSVDTQRFRPDDEERTRVRRELGLADTDVAIGVVAQITPRKRQVELVRAFNTVHNTMPHAKLLVVGGALFNQQNQAYGDLLKRTVAELGLQHKVLLIGKRSDVPAVLNALDILAQNSDREPLGMTLLEAMATEKPVVTTLVDGTPEVVDDGIDGYLVPVDDPAILMQRLQTLAGDPDLRARLGKAGPRKARSRFSPEEQMRRMHAFYDRLLASQEIS